MFHFIGILHRLPRRKDLSIYGSLCVWNHVLLCSNDPLNHLLIPLLCPFDRQVDPLSDYILWIGFAGCFHPLLCLSIDCEGNTSHEDSVAYIHVEWVDRPHYTYCHPASYDSREVFVLVSDLFYLLRYWIVYS